MGGFSGLTVKMILLINFTPETLIKSAVTACPSRRKAPDVNPGQALTSLCSASYRRNSSLIDW
jgi:hypothetical protein